MDVQQQGILTLIRSGLTGEHLALPETFDLEQAYEVLLRHQMLTLGYLGAVNCGIARQHPVVSRLFQNYGQCLRHSENQLAMAERICKAFDEAGVDYMPLKGCRIKQIYPAPELRSMGDMDILIRVEQYETIRPLLRALGLTEQLESDHELIWEKDKLMVELHKRLIPSYNRDYYRYFGDGWRLAQIECGTRYRMSAEDEFVYLFTHFAKHYRDGGIGLRHLADLWVYLHAYPELDMLQVRQELERLSLLTFFENTKKAFDAWLEDEPWDEMACFVMSHVFGSGAYGTQEGHELSSVIRGAQGNVSKKQARFLRYFGMVFPSLEEMKQVYPILERMPVLLPGCWVFRAVRAVLFRRSKVGAFAARVRTTDAKAVDAYERDLTFVGLNFKFEE